jgi:hypothetical protein
MLATYTQGLTFHIAFTDFHESNQQRCIFQVPPPWELPLFNVRFPVPLFPNLPSSEKKVMPRSWASMFHNKQAIFTPEPYNFRAPATWTDNNHHPSSIVRTKPQLVFVPFIIFCQLLPLYSIGHIFGKWWITSNVGEGGNSPQLVM